MTGSKLISDIRLLTSGIDGFNGFNELTNQLIDQLLWAAKIK